MKIFASASLLALLAVSGVSAFQPASIPSSAFRSSGSALSAVKPQGNNGAHRPNPTVAFAAAAASGLAALTLASQVAFAGMLPVNSVDGTRRASFGLNVCSHCVSLIIYLVLCSLDARLSLVSHFSCTAPVFSEQSYSSVVVAAVETMDFSMPSYSDGAL